MLPNDIKTAQDLHPHCLAAFRAAMASLANPAAHVQLTVVMGTVVGVAHEANAAARVTMAKAAVRSLMATIKDDGEGSRKMAYVEYMLQTAVEIFGEEPARDLLRHIALGILYAENDITAEALATPPQPSPYTA